MRFILALVYYMCQLMSIAVFVRAILSWFPMAHNNLINNFLYNITEPVLQPVRRMIPRLGMLDVSPMIAILLLQFIAWIISSI